MDTSLIRHAIVAGQFYPESPEALRKELETSLNQPQSAQQAQSPALMTLLPHAGYVYCGNVIGATLSRIRLPRRLVLLGPNHTGTGAELAVWPEGVWTLPTGNIPVDAELASSLLATKAGYVADTTAHRGEHSLEVLLPFLRHLQPDLCITPVSVSCQPDRLHDAGLALAEVLAQYGNPAEEVAMIISSDMNHYADKETTLALDALALEPLLARDPVRLFNTVASRRISMCGVFPATLGLFACQQLGASRAELVCHTTSADAFGDTTRTVGYAGVYIV